MACVALALAVVLAGCGRAQGVSDTKAALERAGYREVDISLRTGAGIAVALVDAAPGGPAPEHAAAVVWRTLPVRFDKLIVALGAQAEVFSYEALSGRFGPREPSLDRKQIDEKVVRDGLKLMLLLSVAAIVSVAVVVALGLGGLRAARRLARQAGGPASELVDASPTAGASETAEDDEIPS